MLACGIACFWKWKDCHNLKKACFTLPWRTVATVFHVEEDSWTVTFYKGRRWLFSILVFWVFSLDILHVVSVDLPASKSLKDLVLKLLFFHKFNFHWILDYGLMVLHLPAQSCFLLMLIILFLLRSLFSGDKMSGPSSWIVVGTAKGASFSSSLASLLGLRR